MSPCNKTERTGPDGEPTSLVKANEKSTLSPHRISAVFCEMTSLQGRAGQVPMDWLVLEGLF